MKPFCEPDTITSTPHLSMWKGSEATEDTPSTNSSAGCFAASIALRTAPMSEVTPVAVSLCVARTALISWCLSAFSVASISSGSLPVPQGRSCLTTSRPRRLQRSIHRCENWPKRWARTLSPGDSVLVIAASQPPVPDAGKMKAWPFSVSNTFLSCGNSGLTQIGEGRRTMIFRRHHHRALHAIGQIGRTRHEQEIAAGNSGIRHIWLPSSAGAGWF